MTRLDSFQSGADGVTDATDPWFLTRAEIDGRRQALEYARFLVDRVPGYEDAALTGFSTQIGVRETRRVHGDYRLTRDDVLGARQFDDQIGLCGAPIEDHRGGPDTRWQYLPEGAAVGIPYRSPGGPRRAERARGRSLLLGDPRRPRLRAVDGPVHGHG